MPLKVALNYNCKHFGRSNQEGSAILQLFYLNSLLDHCRNFYTSVPKAVLVHSPGQASISIIIFVLSKY